MRTESTVGNKHTFRGGAHSSGGSEPQRGHKCLTPGCENTVKTPGFIHCRSCACRQRMVSQYRLRKAEGRCRVAGCKDKQYGTLDLCIHHAGRCMDCDAVIQPVSKRCYTCAQIAIQAKRRIKREETCAGRIAELENMIACYTEHGEAADLLRIPALQAQLAHEKGLEKIAT